MKQILFALIGIALFSISKAQTSFGVKGGLNIAAVGGKDAKGATAMAGFNAGALVRVGLSKSLAFQPELLYSAQGSKLKVSVDGSEDPIDDVTAKVHLNYLSLPLLVQYNHFSGLFIETGPQVGYLLSAKLKAAGEKLNMKDDFEKVDLSWTLGAGYLTPYNIGINARYQYGFSKLGKPDDVDPANKVFSRVFQVGVFYIIQ